MLVKPRVLIGLLALWVSLVSCDDSSKRLRQRTEHHLNFIPQGMAVDKVLYSEEEVFGWGPGGNETGIIVYELPSSVAENIEKKGLAYFSAMPISNNRQDWQGVYRQWDATPMTEADEVWFDLPASDETTSAPKLDNYLNRYGFDISVEPEIEDTVDEIISLPGSFYAYSRGGGIIIVAPEARRVFYVYAG